MVRRRDLDTQTSLGAEKKIACIASDLSFSLLQETPTLPLTPVQSDHAQVALPSRASLGLAE